ncbi:MAG: succinate dehydrogenase iron-sulfur subunit [Chlamydiia bacterium]
MIKTFTLQVLRGTEGSQYIEEFELELTPLMNVISALMEIQKRPINKKGELTTPVVWEQACLEEVCGSCSMLINGTPRQSCTAMIQPILEESGSDTIYLAPFDCYPLVRDLVVDRDRVFQDLKKIQGWSEVDGSRSKEFGPKILPKTQEVMYELSTCMSCGCCLAACPNYTKTNKFMGAALIGQTRLFNLHPNGQSNREDRLNVMMGKGGLHECSKAQNCVQVCPKKIDLVEAIAELSEQTTAQAFREFFGSNAPEE